MHQTLKTVFDQISKRLEVPLAVCGILISTPFSGFGNVVRHGFDILSLIVFLSFYLEENLK